jgi:hypothetical protein
LFQQREEIKRKEHEATKNDTQDSIVGNRWCLGWGDRGTLSAKVRNDQRTVWGYTLMDESGGQPRDRGRSHVGVNPLR